MSSGWDIIEKCVMSLGWMYNNWIILWYLKMWAPHSMWATINHGRMRVLILLHLRRMGGSDFSVTRKYPLNKTGRCLFFVVIFETNSVIKERRSYRLFSKFRFSFTASADDFVVWQTQGPLTCFFQSFPSYHTASSAFLVEMDLFQLQRNLLSSPWVGTVLSSYSFQDQRC